MLIPLKKKSEKKGEKRDFKKLYIKIKKTKAKN